MSCKKRTESQIEDVLKEPMTTTSDYYSTKHLIECEDLKVLNTSSILK